MTDTHEKRRELIIRIIQWAWLYPGKERGMAWRRVEVAIIALTNTAFLQGCVKVQETELADIRAQLQTAQERNLRLCKDYDALQGQLQTQVPALQTLLEEAEAEVEEERQRTTTMTLANDDKRQLLQRMRRERDEARRELVNARRIIRVVVSNRALTSKEVKDALAGVTLSDNLKPKVVPEIEATLVGSREVACADGCGRIVKQGNVAYRLKATRAYLYATKECAQRASVSGSEEDPSPGCDPEHLDRSQAAWDDLGHPGVVDMTILP